MFLSKRSNSKFGVVQAILLKFLGFDRCTFAEFRDDGSLVVLSSTPSRESKRPHQAPFPVNCTGLSPDSAAGETFKVQNPVDDLPPEAVGEAEYFAADRDAFAS